MEVNTWARGRSREAKGLSAARSRRVHQMYVVGSCIARLAPRHGDGSLLEVHRIKGLAEPNPWHTSCDRAGAAKPGRGSAKRRWPVETSNVKRESGSPRARCGFENATSTHDQGSIAALVATITSNVILLLILMMAA